MSDKADTTGSRFNRLEIIERLSRTGAETPPATDECTRCGRAVALVHGLWVEEKWGGMCPPAFAQPHTVTPPQMKEGPIEAHDWVDCHGTCAVHLLDLPTTGDAVIAAKGSSEFVSGQRAALSDLALTFRQITFVSREDEQQRARVADFIDDYAARTLGPPMTPHVHDFKMEPSGYAIGFMKACSCGETHHVG